MFVDYHGKRGIIRKAERSGYFHIWPVDARGYVIGNALRINLTPRDIERLYPTLVEAIRRVPDSTD